MGDENAPDADPPYLVLYLLDAPAPDGPLASPDSIWSLRYQVTGVGRAPAPHQRGSSGAQQARWALDLAFAAMAGAFAVPGRAVARVIPQLVGSPPERDVTPSVHQAVGRFTVITTPA